MTEEDNLDSEGGPSQVNSFRLLNVIKKENGVPQKVLMSVATLINGKMVSAMKDIVVSHSFISK